MSRHTMKVCIGCQRCLPATEFATNDKRADGKGYYYKNRCKPCWKDYKRVLKARAEKAEAQIAARRLLPPEGFNPVIQQYLRSAAC